MSYRSWLPQKPNREKREKTTRKERKREGYKKLKHTKESNAKPIPPSLPTKVLQNQPCTGRQIWRLAIGRCKLDRRP